MDRELLQRLLAEGRSLEDIGRRVERDASTVSYWLQKHGLQANNSARHAPKGPIDRDVLTALVEDGKSIREIGEHLGRSGGTVRHWLGKYGMRTHGKRGRPEARLARAAGLSEVQLECPHHGLTTFVAEARGYYRCLKCRSAGVAARRRRVKEILVGEAGGRCVLCGYRSYLGALHFHHRDPSLKEFHMAAGGISRSIDRCREEMRKCVLLCSNCHAEVEGGVTSLPA